MLFTLKVSETKYWLCNQSSLYFRNEQNANKLAQISDTILWFYFSAIDNFPKKNRRETEEFFFKYQFDFAANWTYELIQFCTLISEMAIV